VRGKEVKLLKAVHEKQLGRREGAMKKMMMLAMVCVMALSFTATDAQATALAVGDLQYLGFYTSPEPSSPTDEVGYINNLITLTSGQTFTTIGTKTYTRLDSTLVGPFDSAVTGDTIKKDGASKTNNTIDLGLGGYTYLVGKYDGTQGGGYVWLITDVSGIVTVPGELPGLVTNPDGTTSFGTAKFDVSHISVYKSQTSVPDGGMTLMLLGGALLGLESLRRRFRA
jgi:hypothetical protein